MAIKTETFTTMDSDDFDRLLKETFDLDYEFITEQEANNGASYNYSVGARDLEEAKELGPVKEWTLSEKVPYRLLAALVSAGKLEMGKFLIQVSW